MQARTEDSGGQDLLAQIVLAGLVILEHTHSYLEAQHIINEKARKRVRD